MKLFGYLSIFLLVFSCSGGGGGSSSKKASGNTNSFTECNYKAGIPNAP